MELEARGQLLADLSTLLAELQLDVVGADIATAGAVARDSFAVRYCGVLTPAELEAALRERLRQQLQVRRLLPGDAVLPANLRGGGDDGGDGGGDGDGGSGGAAPPTWLALFDLRAFSHALVVHGGAIGETWSRLLQTRAPQLWKHLIAHDPRPAPERRPGGAPAPPAPVVMLREAEPESGDGAEQWLALLRELMLVQLRTQARHTPPCDPPLPGVAPEPGAARLPSTSARRVACSSRTASSSRVTSRWARSSAMAPTVRRGPAPALPALAPHAALPTVLCALAWPAQPAAPQAWSRWRATSCSKTSGTR